jgi:hypothetical protein
MERFNLKKLNEMTITQAGYGIKLGIIYIMNGMLDLIILLVIASYPLESCCRQGLYNFFHLKY